MVFASGFVEINDINEIDKLKEELKSRSIIVDETKEEKIIFLVERETIGDVKKTLDELRDVDGIRSVYLAYYSLEGGDEEASEGSVPFFNA
ncbi:MAG: chaperone NapD [Nitrospiraceae bacterium]|nr:chaperone NapD [Nitrospiraceae bacterium]